MSTGPLTSTVGAIDVADLVGKIMANEAQDLTPLTTAAASFNAQLSAYGTVSSALSTFQSALGKLNSAAFSAQKATISNTGTGTDLSTAPFTADINADANITPKSQVIQSAGIDAATTFTSGDSMAIKVGTNSPIFVTLGADTTLGGVVDAINNAPGIDVEASIVTDDQGSHLVLTSDTAGSANTIRVTGNGSLSQFAYDPSTSAASTMTQTQAPQDQVAAISGSYDISVTSLAASAKLKSTGFPDGQTFSNGILAIKTGSGTTTVITPTNNTLTGIRDAINNSSAGVNATIVDDGTSSHLVLTAKNSGAVNTITVTGTGDFGKFSTGSWSDESTNPPTTTASSMTSLQTASDAVITIDGVQVKSPTNTINSIAGVTLNLNTVTTADDSYHLAIGNDSSGVQSTAQSFVTAYNTLVGTLGPLTSYNSTTQVAGALQGDSAANSIQNQIRDALIHVVGDAGSLQTLNDVGISLQKDGTLALDSTKLTTATTNSFNSIQALFNSPTDGIVTGLNTLITSMLDPTSGIVATRTTGIQASLTSNAAGQAQIQTRLTADQAAYTSQFNALNVTLSTLQNQQAQLTSELAGLASTS